MTFTKTVAVAAGVFAPGHLGELTWQVPFDLADAVLEETRTRERRLLLAAALFAHESAAFDVHVSAGLGGGLLLRGGQVWLAASRVVSLLIAGGPRSGDPGVGSFIAAHVVAGGLLGGGFPAFRGPVGTGNVC